MVGFTLADSAAAAADDDRQSVHSIASTVATTTSLASRIRDLNIDFGDKLQEQAEEEEAEEEQRQKEQQQQQGEQQHAGTSSRASAPSPAASTAAVRLHTQQQQQQQQQQAGRASTDLPSGVGSEDELALGAGVPHSLQVCCRLFERRSHPPLHLKRMTMAQVEDFRQHGYVVMDGLLTREAAARIKAEAARLAQKGLLQPVSQAHMGVMAANSSSNNNSSSSGGTSAAAGAGAGGASSSACNGCSSSTSTSSSVSAHSQSPSVAFCSSSPRRSASSCGPPPGFANGAAATANGSSSGCNRGATAAASQQQRQQQQGSQQQGSQQQQQQQRWGELRMPLQLGQPPADTAVFAPLMAAMQELQEDLSEFVRLRSKGTAEYCLCQLPSGSSPVPRHKDAWPDDGSAAATATTSSGSGSGSGSTGVRQDAGAAGGAVGVPPGSSPPAQQQQLQQQLAASSATAAGQAAAAGQTAAAHLGPAARRVSMFTFLNPDWDKEGGGVVRLWPPSAATSGRPSGPPSTTTVSAASAARRSPTSSDAGTTFSELSDCGSLRVAFLGSTTSSVIAEASAPDHDTYSLDGISVAESEAERQGFEWVECEGGDMALDIAPLAGRVLLVLSGAVDHALLPGSGSNAGCDTVFVRAWCC